MDDYLKQFREMISLRGLTEHTVISYSTYIRAYLIYLDNVLQKLPGDVSWQDLRDYVLWLKKSRDLSDRTINAVVSQLRFFTIYVLHKTWEPSQLPLRRFDTFLPYVPSQKAVRTFIAAFSNLKHKAILALMYSSGLRVGEVRLLRYEDICRSKMRIHIRKTKNRSDRYAILSINALDILTQYWFQNGRPIGYLFPIPGILICQWLLLLSTSSSMPWSPPLAWNIGSPAMRSAMLLVPIFTKMERICSPSKRCLAINP